MRLASSLVSLAVVLVASSAAAQPDAPPAAEPAPDASPPGTAEPAPSATPPAPRAEAPAAEAPPVRDEGMRLGLDLGFTRATTARADNVSGGTPTLLPIGLDLSFRTSKRLLLGLHGSMALGSRDDCLSSDHCTARDYTLGGHFETTFLDGQKIVPWFRYGLGWELMYHGGSVVDGSTHQYRDAIDLVDARIGADYVVSRSESGKTARIGAYLGMIAGLGVGRTGGNSQNRGIVSDYASAGHVWLGLGLRATLDP